MADDFTIQVDDRELRAALGRIIARVQDATPLMRAIARALRNHTEDAFEHERSPFGATWQELTAKTQRRKVASGKRRGAHPILKVSSGGLASEISTSVGKDYAQIGASKPYAALHQFGGTPGMPPGPAAVPARPYLPIDPHGHLPEPLHDEIMDLMTTYLAD